MNLLFLIDKANGYTYTGTASAAAVSSNVNVKELDFDYYRIGQIRERYGGEDEEEEETLEAQEDLAEGGN